MITRATFGSKVFGKYQHYMGRVLEHQALLFMAAMMLVNGLNYLYAFALARLLGAESYGAYTAFASLFLILSLWPLSLQHISARYRAMSQDIWPLAIAKPSFGVWE
ncbi:MAG: hypothetical protein R2880_18530 [Deinococcales bacterium]